MENDLTRQNSGNKQTSKQSQNRSAVEEVVSVWLVKISRNFRNDLTAAMSDTFVEGLSDLYAETLREAFGWCLKNCLFMPTIAEIRNAYAAIVSEQEHSNPSTNKNPAWACQQCHGEWSVVVTKMLDGKESRFAVPCPDVERHRSEWAESHPNWQYKPARMEAPLLRDIR